MVRYNWEQKNWKSIILWALFIGSTFTSFSQGKKDFEKFSAIPKLLRNFPIDYKIKLPNLDQLKENNNWNYYDKFISPTLRKTQMSMSFNNHGVNTTIVNNSIYPHAQLDTTTIIRNKKDLLGIWRMLIFRTIQFNDSISFDNEKVIRLPNEIIEDKSKDEAYIVVTENKFKIYAKEIGKNNFKKMGSSKYSLENYRFIMLYKFLKGGSGVSQIGIDENGFLIVNYPKIIVKEKPNKYLSGYTIINQYILEKVKQ